MPRMALKCCAPVPGGQDGEGNVPVGIDQFLGRGAGQLEAFEVENQDGRGSGAGPARRGSLSFVCHELPLIPAMRIFPSYQPSGRRLLVRVTLIVPVRRTG